MNRIAKWMIPAAAAFAMFVGVPATPAAAQDAKAAADAKAVGTVTGKVTGQDGKPVADVEVMLYKSMPRPDRAQTLQAEPARPERGQRQRPEPVAKGKTDKDGKYTLKDVPAGEYRVSARVTEGNLRAMARVTVEATKTATADLKLAEGRGRPQQ